MEEQAANDLPAREEKPLLSVSGVSKILSQFGAVHIDSAVQQCLEQYAGMLVDDVAKLAVRFAQHRHSESLATSDIRLALDKLWGLSVGRAGPTAPFLQDMSCHRARISEVTATREHLTNLCDFDRLPRTVSGRGQARPALSLRCSGILPPEEKEESAPLPG
ncbi:hypothetical protein PAPYR_6110 [Paratrimastix pyriformis]|uniref:Transcription initiation factor TFIID subunit 12 domain-containing protein n=1 Tax=Paratrimastix pyriformis TaxID=342808 RepID=A0ABQ8UFV3_9EUKA|nr:hypothetical protein PAPYR_6110 [Paratrimastix pyriformis]